MLLTHAKALATSEVERGGVKVPKDGPFTDEQLAAEDWEPVRAEWVPPTPPEDCGCGPEVLNNGMPLMKSEWKNIVDASGKPVSKPVPFDVK